MGCIGISNKFFKLTSQYGHWKRHQSPRVQKDGLYMHTQRRYFIKYAYEKYDVLF